MARPLAERGGGGIGLPDVDVGASPGRTLGLIATFLTTFLTTGATGAAGSSAARLGGAALPLEEITRAGAVGGGDSTADAGNSGSLGRS